MFNLIFAGKYRKIRDRNAWCESCWRWLAQGCQSTWDRAGHTVQEESGKRWRLHQCHFEPRWGIVIGFYHYILLRCCENNKNIKEMILGTVNKNPPPVSHNLLCGGVDNIDCVTGDGELHSSKQRHWYLWGLLRRRHCWPMFWSTVR